jgi:hypothetical protein
VAKRNEPKSGTSEVVDVEIEGKKLPGLMLINYRASFDRIYVSI